MEGPTRRRATSQECQKQASPLRAAFQAFELLLDRMKDNLLRAGDYKSSCVATINVNGLANTSLALPAIIDSQPYAAAFFFQEVGGSDFETRKLQADVDGLGY